jgi:hypothetical protein
VQPIIDDTEQIVAHCESFSVVCSNTSRTARSLTSGVNVDALPITVSSSRNSVSGNPGAVHYSVFDDHRQ